MSSGTQSPPCRLKGSESPMGVSSIDGSCSEAMRDIEQRAQYFSDDVKEMCEYFPPARKPSPKEKEKQAK